MKTFCDCNIHTKEAHLNIWQNVGHGRDGAFQEELGVSEVKEPTIIPEQKTIIQTSIMRLNLTMATMVATA